MDAKLIMRYWSENAIYACTPDQEAGPAIHTL